MIGRSIASVLGSLGNAYVATGPVDAAYGYLNEGLGMAREVGNSALAAASSII